MIGSHGSIGERGSRISFSKLPILIEAASREGGIAHGRVVSGPRQFSSSEGRFTIKDQNGWQIYPVAGAFFCLAQSQPLQFCFEKRPGKGDNDDV